MWPGGFPQWGVTVVREDGYPAIVSALSSYRHIFKGSIARDLNTSKTICRDKLLELYTLAIVCNIESLLVVFAHSLVDSIELDGNHYNEKYFRKKKINSL